MKILLTFIFAAVFLPNAWSVPESDSAILLMAYIRLSIAEEVRAQAFQMVDSIAEQDASRVRQVADEWFDDERNSLRKVLESRFGDDARDSFERFINEYTSAESANNPDYLNNISSATGLREPPRDYPTLRRLALEQWLSGPLADGTRLLSELQTWSEIRKKDSGAPSLDHWLARLEPPPPAPTGPGGVAGALAAAEAPPSQWSGSPQQVAASPLGSFAVRRRQRREQAIQLAQAGMQQMTMERQAAEQEYASRKMAEAQAEANAMRVQSEKLASVEAEAIAQRENSWGNRIKRIVGSTISAGVGAFTGGIGAVAAQRAVDEIFR